MKQYYCNHLSIIPFLLVFLFWKKQAYHCYALALRYFIICCGLIYSNTSMATELPKEICTMSCKGQVTIGLGTNGEYLVTPMTFLTNPSCDPSDFTISIKNALGEDIPALMTCDHVGQTFMVFVTRINDGNQCSGSLTISDNIAPEINCMNLFVFCYEGVTPSDIGYPSISDNCSSGGNIEMNFTDVFTDLPCFSQQNNEEITAKITRNWIITDAAGNTTTCDQDIFIKRVTVNDIIFPKNKDGFESDKLDCKDDPTDLNLTGQPSINNVPITSGGSCDMAVTHEDQKFSVCGSAGYKIIRTWTVVDWCSSDFILDAQVIEVTDQSAPVIICPEDFTVGTSQVCAGEVTLPFGIATDNCSNFDWTVSWEFGEGEGPYLDIPTGTYLVTYSAVDDCGNASSCTIQATVEDQTPPVAICESHVVISLAGNGPSTIFATSVNDGSTDNCSFDHAELSKDGVNFSETLEVNCDDLIGNVQIWMRGYDAAGNYSECSTTLNVDDKIPPIIICPLGKTIDCTADANDLALTGEAVVSDNCSIDTLYFSDEKNLDDCQSGTILRTWVAKDSEGNTTSCVQEIIVADMTPLSIIFPEDIDINGCASGYTPTETGEPTLVDGECESVGISHQDVLFTDAPGLCQKILRTWTVVNWCVYTPNDPNSLGYWTHVQVIKIIDDGSSTAPTFSVAGVVNTWSGLLMENVTLQLELTDATPEIETVSGVYQFEDIPVQQTATLTPLKNDHPTNGVTTIDLVFMMQHILGLKKFDSPYLYIAADVNQSKTITTFDLILVRQLILQLVEGFPGNTSWRFVDADYIFQNPSNPLAEDFPEIKIIEGVTKEAINVDFIAIKIGDVNGNALPQ